MTGRAQNRTSIRSSGDLLADRRFAWAEGSLADGDVAGAADLARQVIEIAPRYAPAWFLLGDAYADPRGTDPAGLDLARSAFGMVLRIDPLDSLGARMRLAQMDGGDGAPALTPAYVRALFEGYAGTFDRHLVEGLGYRAPALLRDAVTDTAARIGSTVPFGKVLDLGCGTGLMALALGDAAATIEGVDLSGAMLAKARRTGLYASLHEGDMVEFLAARSEAGADLVVAADVFVYVKDPMPAVLAAATALVDGGLMAFTMQSRDGEGARLGPDGRYAHGRDVAEACASAGGLVPCLIEAVSVRRQGGHDVPGWLVVASKGWA